MFQLSGHVFTANIPSSQISKYKHSSFTLGYVKWTNQWPSSFGNVFCEMVWEWKQNKRPYCCVRFCLPSDFQVHWVWFRVERYRGFWNTTLLISVNTTHLNHHRAYRNGRCSTVKVKYLPWNVLLLLVWMSSVGRGGRNGGDEVGCTSGGDL